jgi:cyclopropane fatty-acyl-phospholipid synthase-like methyltransferase
VSGPRFSTTDVRAYYDGNTRAFVRFGHGRASGAIHRAVWGPGVRTRAAALHYVDDLIAARLGDGRLHVLDLGCGVGASLVYLAQQRDIRGTGVTLSPLQAQLGRERLGAMGLADRVRIIEGDYGALPELEPVDLAYAIESFVHGPSPDRFFAEAARVLRPGGLLIVCDDVRGDDGGRAAQRAIDRFTRGWHVNSLLTPQDLRARAQAAGLAQLSTQDLTGWLELRRPRDRAIAALAALTAWLPRLPTRLAPLIGGSALQTALGHRWIEYHFTVFRSAGG